MNSILNQTQKLVMDRSEQWDKHVSQVKNFFFFKKIKEDPFTNTFLFFFFSLLLLLKKRHRITIMTAQI
jgi:hypothetical protein